MTTATQPEAGTGGPADPGHGRQGGPGRSKLRFWLRRIAALVLLGTALFLVWFGITFSGYVRASDGEPMNVLLAEWGRDHGLGPVVAAAENVYYATVAKTPVGGEPTESAQFGAPVPSATAPSASHPATPAPSGSSRATASAGATPPAPPAPHHLSPPKTIVSPASPALPGEGQWQPVGSTVAGVPAIYATRVRADDVHTSVLASVMWIDTSLTRATLIPGYIEPGGPSPTDGALPKALWPRVLANFNGAFRLQDSNGGYYYEGTTVAPLSGGRASAVFTHDGKLTIGKWGRDASMSSSIAIVRQNLDLIVDHGRSQVDSGQQFDWGATTHGETYAWRSAVGERADGSLVYVGSPGLSAQGLADTLVRAGVQRAMVLDMNNWWVAGFYFSHDKSGAPVCAKLDPNIAEGCDRFLNRYKRDSFQILATPPKG